jgi:hypothetical protein
MRGTIDRSIKRYDFGRLLRVWVIEEHNLHIGGMS